MRVAPGPRCLRALGAAFAIVLTGWQTTSQLTASPSTQALIASSLKIEAVEIIGHRGASLDAPENTLASFQLAWSEQADAVETDVFLTRDGQVVAIHDETPQRFGGPARRVAASTLAELKAIDVGRWKGPKWAGERIPTLAEILAIIPDGKRLFIEIKCGPGILPHLARVLDTAAKRPEQTCLISFSFDVLTRFKRQRREIACYGIAELKRDEKLGRWNPSVEELIENAKAGGLDGLDLGDAPVIDANFVGAIQRSSLALYIWTVDSPQRARELAAAGIDGITTNRPGFLKSCLRGDAETSKL